MVFHHIDPDPLPETDTLTEYSVNTPPETVVTDLLDDLDPLSNPKPSSSSSVPWPGSLFIIRDVSSGFVITLRDGQILLAPPGDLGSMHWRCVETKGWLGFQNPASNLFLGHDANGRLSCKAERHLGWENFCVRLRPEGGYVLLMTHFERLWHVGIKLERGEEKLAKLGNGGSGGIVWEFVKV